MMRYLLNLRQSIESKSILKERYPVKIAAFEMPCQKRKAGRKIGGYTFLGLMELVLCQLSLVE